MFTGNQQTFTGCSVYNSLVRGEHRCWVQSLSAVQPGITYLNSQTPTHTHIDTNTIINYIIFTFIHTEEEF